MKRTFLARRNALLSSANISWGAYALMTAVLILLVRLVAPNFFWTVFTPMFHISDAFTAKSDAFFNSFDDTAALALENEKLRNENAAITIQNQALLQKENSISGLVRGEGVIIAGVVARPPTSPYDTLVLAGGLNDGITQGMEVFGDGNVPLGVISVTNDRFSRATLFSAPGMNTDGWVGKANLPITVRGAGAGAMLASAARSAGIVVGDVVSVPGPGMLPVGIVTRVDSNTSSPSVTLRIMPAMNLFSISWVAVRDTGMTAISL